MAAISTPIVVAIPTPTEEKEKEVKIEKEKEKEIPVNNLPTFTLQILAMIKAGQLQNGLRHSDYQRYRNHCSHRLKRIRKSLKITHGKKTVHKERSSI